MGRLHDIEVDDYELRCVEVIPETLNEEFVSLSAHIAYWAERRARAYRAYLVAKLERERTVSRLRLTVRETLEAAVEEVEETLAGPRPKKNGGAKKRSVTESMVDARVLTDPDYLAARQVEIDTEVEEMRIAGVLTALAAKRDALVGLGASLRIEMQHEPAIRENARAARLNNESG